ncbi:MAG: GAF domain-containing protein [Chloroflexota bacterium]
MNQLEKRSSELIQATHEKQILLKLLSTSTALLNKQALPDVLQTILQGVQSIGFDRVRLYLTSEDGETLTGTAHIGMDESFLGFEISLVYDKLLRQLTAVSSPEIMRRRNRKPFIFDEELDRADVDEWVYLPLTAETAVIGLMVADNKWSKRPIDEEILPALTLCASQATVAIVTTRQFTQELNAKAHDAQQMRNRAYLQEVMTAINTKTELYDIFDITCRSIVELFGVTHCGLVKFDDDQVTGKVVAEYPMIGTLDMAFPVQGIPAEEQLIESKQPFIAEDVAECEELGEVRRTILGHNIQALMIVPIVLNKRVWGSFSLDVDQCCYSFDSEVIALCQLFAEQLAIAIHNSDLLSKATKRAEQLKALSQLTLDMTSTLEVDVLFDKIIQSAVALMDAKGGGIKVYYPEEGYLETLAAVGQRDPQIGRKIYEGAGIAGRLVLSSENHLATDNYQLWDGRIAGLHFGSIVGVKLNWQEQILGVLFVNDENGRTFTEEEIELLQLFADQAALTLTNANLLRAKEEERNRFEQLVRGSPNGIIANDKRGVITVFNEKASQVLQRTQGEMLGRPVWEIYANSQEANHIGNVMQKHGSIANFNTTLVTGEREHVPVRMSGELTKQPDSNGVAYMGYFEDLREIREVRDRLDMILGVSHLLAQADSVQAGLQLLAETMVTFWGNSFCRIFLLDEQQENLEIVAAYPQAGEIGGISWELSVGLKTAVSDWPRLDELLQSWPSNIIKRQSEPGRQILQQWQALLGLDTDIQSLLVVPLRTRNNRVVGLLDLGEFRSWDVAYFTDEQQMLMEAIAQHASVLIERFHNHEITKQAEKRLRDSYEASNKLVYSADENEIWHEIIVEAQQVAKADGVRLVLVDPIAKKGTDLITTDSNTITVTSIVRTNGLTMEVFETGRAVTVRDAQKEKSRVNPSFFSRGICAAIGLPVIVDGNPIGVMWIYYNKPRTFSQSEEVSLQLFINQAAIAYDNAHHIRTLDGMRKAVMDMAGTDSVAETLHQITVHARDLLEAQSAVVWAYDDIRQQFILDDSVSAGIIPESWERLQANEPRTTGTVSRIMRDGRVIVNDISAPQSAFLSQATCHRLLEIGVASFLGLALQVGDENLGILYVNYDRARTFSTEEQKTASTFAYHAALALKKAKLAERNQKTQELAKIVARVTNLDGSLDEKLKEIVKGIRDVLVCDAVTLYVYDPERDVLKSPSTSVGVHFPSLHHRSDGFVRQQSIVRRMLEQETTYVADDVSKDPWLQHTGFAKNERIASCAVVPLRVGQEPVGVMFVNSRTPRDFTSDDLGALELFANQTAVAIHNAHLFERQQKQTAMLDVLHQAAYGVTSSLDLEETLQAIVKQAIKLMGTEGNSDSKFSHLALVNGHTFTFQATYPPEKLPSLRQKFGVVNLEEDAQIGITGEAILSRGYVLVPDARLNANYLELETAVCSILSVPIISDDRVIGVISVEHTELNGFNQHDILVLQTLAEYAAIAIQNARLYEWLETIGRISSEAANNLDITRLLRTVCHRLEQEVRRSVSVSIRLYDPAKNLLMFDPSWHESLSERMDMGGDEGRESQRLDQGICGWVATNKESWRVGDVTEPGLEPSPLRFISKMRSELCVPILYGEARELIGVLDIQSPNRDAFDDNDQFFLETLAAQLAIAIHKVQEYKVVTARTGLAWMGMTTNTWHHSLAGDALAIDATINSLRNQVQALTRDPAVRKKIEAKLVRVENLAEKMLQRPITPTLTETDGEIVVVNELIRQKQAQLWKTAVFRKVKIKLKLSATEQVGVRASGQWLQQVLELLLNNAVRAMADCQKKKLVVRTVVEHGRLKVFIHDNGHGISPEIMDKLFLERIENSNGGIGIGLLMAELIVQMYEGNIWVKETSAAGTTFAFSLPVVALP